MKTMERASADAKYPAAAGIFAKLLFRVRREAGKHPPGRSGEKSKR